MTAFVVSLLPRPRCLAVATSPAQPRHLSPRVLLAQPRRSAGNPSAPPTAGPGSAGLSSAGGGSAGGGSSGGGGGSGDGGEEHTGPRSLLSFYLSLLERRALPTKVATSAVLTLISDIVAQLFERRSSSDRFALDRRRMLSLFLVGGLLTAPFFHFLYAGMEAYMPAAGRPLNVFLQLFVDQLLAGPAWLLGFFTALAVLDPPFRTDGLKKQVKRDFVPSLKLAWTIFPPVQLVSFAFLPPATRVLTLNLVDLVYTTALSYIKHRPHEGKEEPGR